MSFRLTFQNLKQFNLSAKKLRPSLSGVHAVACSEKMALRWARGWLLFGNPLADRIGQAVCVEHTMLPRRETLLTDPAGVVTPAGPGGGGHLSGANGLPGCASPCFKVLNICPCGDIEDVA